LAVTNIREACRAVGLDYEQLNFVERLRQADTGKVYRLKYAGESLVLKWFTDPGAASEIHCYDLLQDLAASPVWRLAREADATRADVGAAVAGWYRTLHAAGDALRGRTGLSPGWLEWEVDALTPETILETGRAVATGDLAFWRWAAQVYGPVSELERILDEATSDLYSLVVAARRPTLPRWAIESVERVRSGEVRASLRRALQIL